MKHSLYIIPVTKFVNYVFDKEFEFDDTILGMASNVKKNSTLEGIHFQGDISIIQGKVSIGEKSKIGNMTGKMDTRGYDMSAEFTEHSYILESGYEVQADKSFSYHKKLPNSNREFDVVLEHTENVSKFDFNCKKKG
ncbi:hypothetical protein [Treponema sp. R80B11-R83G3]